MSTDGSVQFFSTIDEDLNVTVETLIKMMQRNLSSEKVEFVSIASFPKLGPNRAILTGKNELLIVVNSSIGRQGGVFTYKPASGVHVPDLRSNAQLVKVPN